LLDIDFSEFAELDFLLVLDDTLLADFSADEVLLSKVFDLAASG